MATKTNRTNPVRTTNKNNNTGAVRPVIGYAATVARANTCTKALRGIAKRSDSVSNHLTKTYEEIECIAQTVDALRIKVEDGQVSGNAIIKMLESIENRLSAVNGRICYAELTCATISGDADWVADGNDY
jgi:hypothetical protein